MHGWGNDESQQYYTRLNFSGTTYGVMASEHPADSTPWYRWGLQNIQFDNFTFTGSPMYLVIRKNLVVQNVNANDIAHGYAAIRLTCPCGTGSGCVSTSTGHYWANSPDAVTENVLIQNCHTNNTTSHGFHLHYQDLRGGMYNNITFDNCSATTAGSQQYTSIGSWSVGFNLSEAWLLSGCHQSGEETIQNLTVNNCSAFNCWESGFHFENKVKKIHCHFIDCTSNDNGQKYINTPQSNWNDNGTNLAYGAGYMMPYVEGQDSDLTFENCVANGNGAWGWRFSSSTNCPTMTNCSGDEYPTDQYGNGRGTKGHGYPGCGGLCRKCGPGGCVQTPNPTWC